MIPYTFSILRYIHDGVTAEFVNIGVAVYSGDAAFLAARCTTQYGRISRVFDRIDGDRFRQIARFIEEAVNKLGERVKQQTLSFADLPTSLDKLLAMVLPADDSSIQFSPMSFGVSADLARTVEELFERYVGRYAGPGDVASRTDDDVWRVFRERFEKRGVASHLAPKRIVAPDYEYMFRAGWKNGSWHVYEPVSFDLMEPASLIDKANRWFGRATNLAESPEPFRLYFLVGPPSKPELQGAFDKARRILSKSPIAPELVMEGEADALAVDLEREMHVHGADERTLF